MKKLAVLVFICGIIIYDVNAYNPDHLQKAKNYSSGTVKDTNFKGFDLSVAHLEGYNLKDLDLTGANLQGVHLEKANMSGTNFTSANCQNVVLNEAHLEKTIFNDAILSGAQFIRAHLEGAHFKRAKLNDVKFYNAHLEGAILSETILFCTDFIHARCEGAVFNNAQNYGNLGFYNTNLVRAQLKNIDFSKGVVFNWADLSFANFDSSSLPNTSFPMTTNIRDARFTNCNLQGSDFRWKDIEGVSFENSNLTAAKFWGAGVKNTSFRNTTLSSADLHGMDNKGVRDETLDFTNAHGERVYFYMDEVWLKYCTKGFNGANIQRYW